MGQLDMFIAECNRYLDSGDGDPCDLVWRAYNAYAREIIEGLASNAFNLDNPDIRMVRDWLMAQKERNEHELAVAQAAAGCTNVSNVNSAEASATASIDATFNSTMSVLEQ